MKTKPGETPIDDISGLLVNIGTREELNKHEYKNIIRPTVKYVALNGARDVEFDFFFFLELHREMFCDVWDWAGKLRKVDLNLGVPWIHVEPSLYELPKRMPYWGGTVLERAVLLHHSAVAIHPFLNGNGRWSRLLANIFLKRNGMEPTRWPEAVGETSPVRQEYLAAVKAADLFDFEPLIELHRRFTAD